MRQNNSTAWDKVDQWYDQLVGPEGHYYHQHVVIPKLLKLLNLENIPFPSLLDLACGQGVLAKHLPPTLPYTGIDLSPSLIARAKKGQKKNQHFHVADICDPLPLKGETFTHATLVLALQNVMAPGKALIQVSQHLVKGGLLAIVLNHPCFRIPRQSSWEIDQNKKIQYRRVDRYLSPLKIPIRMNPGKKTLSENTWSFHHSLTDYSRFLSDAGFVIILMEEWISDKMSSGSAAKMENRAREEFPLFLTLLAQKI